MHHWETYKKNPSPELLTLNSFAFEIPYLWMWNVAPWWVFTSCHSKRSSIAKPSQANYLVTGMLSVLNSHRTWTFVMADTKSRYLKDFIKITAYFVLTKFLTTFLIQMYCMLYNILNYHAYYQRLLTACLLEPYHQTLPFRIWKIEIFTTAFGSRHVPAPDMSLWLEGIVSLYSYWHI